MTNGMDFYRLKFEFLGEDAEGKLVSKKEEEDQIIFLKVSGELQITPQLQMTYKNR